LLGGFRRYEFPAFENREGQPGDCSIAHLGGFQRRKEWRLSDCRETGGKRGQGFEANDDALFAIGENTGAAVLVFPGGGYWILAIALEGTEVCDWLTSKGITCVLLKHRVPGNGLFPRSGAYPRSPMALEDAQRAIRLVRLHAAEWGIDPHKIGVLGFSAGGHLVAGISTHFKKRLYAAVDAADKESCRPDFGVALYPGPHAGKYHERFSVESLHSCDEPDAADVFAAGGR